MTRAYIANKMRGKPQYNFNWFHEATIAAEILLNFRVVSPHLIDIAEGYVHTKSHVENARTVYDEVVLADGFTEEDAFKRDLKQLLNCDLVLLGPDWHASKGALLEAFVASNTGIPLALWREVHNMDGSEPEWKLTDLRVESDEIAVLYIELLSKQFDMNMVGLFDAVH